MSSDGLVRDKQISGTSGWEVILEVACIRWMSSEQMSRARNSTISCQSASGGVHELREPP